MNEVIKMPQTQNQEKLPVQEQLKNIRSYLFQSANDMQITISSMESKNIQLEKEIRSLRLEIEKMKRG